MLVVDDDRAAREPLGRAVVTQGLEVRLGLEGCEAATVTPLHDLGLIGREPTAPAGHVGPTLTRDQLPAPVSGYTWEVDGDIIFEGPGRRLDAAGDRFVVTA